MKRLNSLRYVRTDARPDFVTLADLERWEAVIFNVPQDATMAQLIAMEVMLAAQGGRELFYAAQWLGETLEALGVARPEAQSLCEKFGEIVADGALPWTEAQRIAGVFKWLNRLDGDDGPTQDESQETSHA